jgi:S1-C subfamily serine protease
MTVMDLAAHAPAEKAGLKVGDVIVAIDGTAVLTRSLSDIRRSLKIAPMGHAIAVTYSREGASNTTQVVPCNLIPE